MRRVALSVFLSSPLALAHGPAPTALSALGPFDDGAPAVVRTNIVLAVRRDGAYRYVCPAQWGAEDRFPPVTRDADDALVVPFDGQAWRGDGCTFDAVPLEGWSGSQIAHVPGWVVERRGADTVVWRLDGETAEVAEHLEGAHYDSAMLDAGGRLWMAAARPTPTLWRAGAGSADVEVDVEPQFMDLRVVGDSVAAVSPVTGGTVLLESDDGGRTFAVTLTAEIALHGPIDYGGARLALVDGAVWTDAGDGFVRGPERPWTCLQRVDEVALACVQRGLARITGPAAEPLAEAVFALDEVTGIDDTCPPPGELRDLCELQWLHFGGEAGLVRFDAGAPTGSDAGPDGTLADAQAHGGDASGCACHGGPGAPLLAWPLFIALRRRS